MRLKEGKHLWSRPQFGLAAGLFHRIDGIGAENAIRAYTTYFALPP